MKNKADWIVAGGRENEIAHCVRCGEGLELGMPQRVKVFLGTLEVFQKAHRLCQAQGYIEPTPKTPEEWRQGRDVGISSMTIYYVMTGIGAPHRFDVPHDPEDFGRCFRLLNLFPEWRARLSEIAARFPAWTALIQDWTQLEEVYRRDLPTGRSKELYQMIKARTSA